MDSKQQLVATAGLGLVAVNYWTSNQKPTLAATVWSKKDPAASHRVLAGIVGELFLVALFTFGAGTSDTGANAVLAILAALWILWAMQHTAKGRTPGRPGYYAPTSATQTAPKTGGL